MNEVLYYPSKRKETIGVVIHHFGVDCYYDREDLQKLAFTNLFKKNPQGTYHNLITYQGTILKGNDEDIVVYHANNNYYNNTTIANCLWGDFTKSKPSIKQIESLVKLIANQQKKYKFKVNNIWGHQEVGVEYTDCPGVNLIKQLNQIKILVEQEVTQLDWKKEAFMEAIKRGWHTEKDRTPETIIDFGTLDAVLLNVVNWLTSQGYIKTISEDEEKRRAKDIGETIAQTFINEIKKNFL